MPPVTDSEPIAPPQLLPLISELYIVTKDLRVQRLGDVMKPAQVDFIERCQRQLDSRGQIRAIVLKARQLGMSTIIEAILFALSMANDHFKSLIVSHEDKSSAHILGMTKFYWSTYVFKELHEFIEKYNGRNHLAWTNHSDIHIATAKNVAGGRSTTIQCLHGSETAYWPDAENLMGGLKQAIPSFGLNAIFIESTANGVGNYFHKECNAAMKGESEYEFFFYPWHEEPEYTAAYLPDEMQGRYALMGELDEEEARLRERFNLTAGQLLWRRWCITNRCHGDINRFRAEYPSTPHEAFIATGRNVFSLPHLLDHYVPRRGRKGKLVKLRGKVRFMEDPQGWLTLFAEPSDDRDWGVYLAGGDPTHTTTGDFACIQVINRRTLEQVAVYRRKIDPINFGKDMQLVGTYFNLAMLAPEKEGPGYASVGCIVGDFYPNVYQSQRIDKMQGKPTTDLAGWSTNVNTKHLAISHLVKLFGEPLAHAGNQTYGLVVHDEVTLLELRDYVTSEKGLGYENSDGSEYDDGVMALAIAAAVHAIEPKPGAYEEVAEHVPPPRHAPIAAGLTSGRSRPIDNQPRDTPVTAADDNELPEAPWEAWGRPREDS